MTSHHSPKDAQRSFNIVFQARFSLGRDASEEYQTITYSFVGTLRGAKLKATDLFKHRFETYCRRGDVNVDIVYGDKIITSKTFWHGSSWATAHHLVESLNL